MRTIRKCVICGCCKQKVEVPIMLSRYLGATGLDNRPCNEAELPVVQKCSRCGYCNFSIEGEIADKTRKRLLRRQRIRIKVYLNCLEAVGEELQLQNNNMRESDRRSLRILEMEQY